jgi:hypothetical protein
MTTTFQMNGTFKFIISHIVIIGGVVGALITVGRWLESTRGDITYLKECAIKVESRIEPQVIKHDLDIAVMKESFVNLRQGQQEINDTLKELNRNIQRHINKNGP